MVDVVNQNEQNYALHVSTQHEALYATLVSAQHSAPIHYIVSRQHEASYVALGPVVIQHEIDYKITDLTPVVGDHEADYVPLVSAQQELDYALLGNVTKQHESPYGLNIQVVTQNEQNWDLLPLNPVTKQHRSIYNIGEAAVINITSVPFITKNSENIKIVNCSVYQDEQGFAWNCRVQLAELDDYAKFGQDEEFIVNLYGEEFTFIVDAKSLNRGSPASVVMLLEGISPSAVYAVPRADPITRVWDVGTLASDVADELLEQSVDWQIVDWTIPAYRLGVARATPMEIVQLIAQAAGGLVETNPDGTVLVRHRFPVSVPDYDLTAADQVYTDDTDNLSVDEGIRFNNRVNRLTIRDQEEAILTDRIEYETDTDNSGQLRVYPSPYRDIVVNHTGPNSVVLSRVGVVTRQETEVIEIFGGTGSVQYPILSVDSITWKAQNLGGVVFDGVTLQSTAGDGYSLLEITYTTRAVIYDVTHNVNEKVQFLVEDA